MEKNVNGKENYKEVCKNHQRNVTKLHEEKLEEVENPHIEGRRQAWKSLFLFYQKDSLQLLLISIDASKKSASVKAREVLVEDG